MTRNPGQLPRGVDRSHAHHSDSLIDPATDELYVPPAGEQRVRLLGPFDVAYNAANLATTGVHLADVSEGQVIFGGYIALTENWNNLGTNPSLRLDFFYDGSLAGEYFAIVDPVSTPAFPIDPEWPFLGGAQVGEGFVSAPLPFRVVLADMEIRLSLVPGAGAGTPSAGAAKIYVLIAEPAS